MILTSPIPCVSNTFISHFLLLDLLYFLSSAEADSILLLGLLHFLSLEESDLIDGESDNDGYDSRSAGTCNFPFCFDHYKVICMIILDVFVAWVLTFFFQ